MHEMTMFPQQGQSLQMKRAATWPLNAKKFEHTLIRTQTRVLIRHWSYADAYIKWIWQDLLLRIDTKTTHVMMRLDYLLKLRILF